jgi:hypothetical protein
VHYLPYTPDFTLDDFPEGHEWESNFGHPNSVTFHPERYLRIYCTDLKRFNVLTLFSFSFFLLIASFLRHK